MLYPQDGTAFDMLARFIEHEYVDPADMEMRGMAAAIGIVKGQPFAPDAHARELLDKAALTATRIGHVSFSPSTLVKNGLWYHDRHWINVFPATPPLPQTRSTTSTHAPAFSLSPIPRVPAWR